MYPVSLQYCRIIIEKKKKEKKEEEEERKKNNLPVLRVPGVVLLRRVFATRGALLVMKTLEDER